MEIKKEWSLDHSFLFIYLYQGEGFDVMKSGDARVALIGFPSVGKVKK